MKRREFIKNVFSAAMAAPYFIPAAVLGRNGAVAPSNRITLGCIGVGGMGAGNLNGFLTKPNAQVLAVCDVDTAHRNNARDLVNKAYGNSDCATYNDFREVLARGDIDAVMIATPDHWHGIIAVAAARARKDIYGEKPLAYTIAEGRAIVGAAQRYGVVRQTGSWQRSQQHFRFGCELGHEHRNRRARGD